MGIVEAEPIEESCHLCDVFTHVRPQVGGVSRTDPIAQLDGVTPDIHLPSQIGEVLLLSKVDQRVVICNPAIMDNFGLCLVVENREVGVEQVVLFRNQVSF